ncbi:Leucine-rich repeat receptor-like protein kinase family [Rhynchospora pubera]|uniref:Leucine-rich repeat receptor-like protein kinase family n=1 Tax=Rhynchospora pubera TaxID=906938 RepID=A0AAV8GF93_9POAL|nr:Leucine-rich repeat receptor-like protein kinase family [Rhynchospora pubera]
MSETETETETMQIQIQSLFLISIFFSLLSSPTISLTLPSDIAALADFKSTITSPRRLSCLFTWNFTASDPCEFPCGISCARSDPNRYSRIIAITLDPIGYSARLPDSLANLTALQHLDLSGNAFYNRIPGSLFMLPSLKTLVLASNSFTGPIPASVVKASALQKLDLSRNSITGSVPQFLSSLSSLTTLDLSYNRLSGPIPDTLPLNLVQLALRGNSITGFLKQSAFAPLGSIQVIELAENRLQGKLESWFFLLPSLQQVNLSNNSFTGISVQSPTASNTNQLVAIDLGFNQIKGTLPVQLAQFGSLVAVSLRHNALTGPVPAEYCMAKKGVGFRRLLLDGNFLSGEVPEGFFEIKDFVGSFGDNCLERCPDSMAFCSPAQKPQSICKRKQHTNWF